jgi:hypothetical protein
MSERIEITVKVNGKVVPLSNISTETFNKIRDAESEKDAPVFSKTDKGAGRLIVKMTPCVKKYFEEFAKSIPIGQYCSFEPTGFFGSYDLGKTWNEARNYYGGETAVPIFEEN